ncbi:uncharacterized protein K452DRAFT_304369 [Aplosporella prunicola CBS 121167]|uniref:Serine hydrolase FSH domain-containing protein n=1 Tax=Aplosporella prunicola CBS 121167 TaxID=1176127 RepID=A0A6A6BTV1_9PEZI|nr:uncharacterized protein K452DRAFT_304369 [Aplosporella prunicola CBS 121167]KAF2147559.1 hypothetical protein K452DRAFT_304369 [Aplosporella prunicola CBS 121167]
MSSATQTTGFLSFNRRPPTIHILGTDPTIAPQLLAAYRAESFSVHYHGLPSPTPSEKDSKAFKALLKTLPDPLALGEYFAIVAFGAAATLALQVAQKPWNKLAALVAYYPSLLPSPGFKYPSGLPLVLHLAGAQQAGTGGSTRAFWYRGTEPGFAEEDLEEWDEVAAGLAWSRTLAVVRKGFGISSEFEMEDLVEQHNKREFLLLALPC